MGPTATVAAAEYLVTHASSSDWLGFLMNSRITVIVPFANAEGFAHSRREEAGIDPNRDFAFDVAPTACMQTMAGRAINEVFREFIFSMSITFHGGANVIAYQWGDTKHCQGYPRNCRTGYISSDDKMMRSVGTAMSKFASNSPSEGPYQAGPCNDPKIIYPVHGGMEDWAYGASWHQSATVCTPSTHGGYPPEKTRYNNLTHRMPNFLVEASTRKKPSERELGTDADVLTPGGQGDGHVSRNIRLILVGIDTLAPYVRITSVSVAGATLGSVKRIAGSQEIQVSWGVGGCFTIDATVLHVEVQNQAGKPVGAAAVSPPQSGQCYWAALDSKGRGDASHTSGNHASFTAPFAATLAVPEITGGAHVVISVHTRTDSAWNDASNAQGDSPKQPQTHIVRARLDPTWYGRQGPYEIVGAEQHVQVIAKLPYDMSCDEACQAVAAATAATTPGPKLPVLHSGVRRSATAQQTGPFIMSVGLQVRAISMPLAGVGFLGMGLLLRRQLRRHPDSGADLVQTFRAPDVNEQQTQRPLTSGMEP